MAKLIQICASQNDLFGLDGEGRVYHYNFKTNSWMKLGQGRSDRGDSARADNQTAKGQLESRTSPPRN